MKDVDGNLGKYDLSPFEKCGCGFWVLYLDERGWLVRDDHTICVYEWRLIHENGDIYRIEYSSHESHIEELFKGRIKDVDFFWTLMRCFREFDKTLKQHSCSGLFSINR